MPWISNPWLRYQCYPAINGGPFQCHKKRISGIDLPCIDPSYVLILICEAEWPPSRGNWNGTSSHFHYVWCFIHRIIIHVYIYIHIHIYIYTYTYTYIYIFIHCFIPCVQMYLRFTVMRAQKTRKFVHQKCLGRRISWKFWLGGTKWAKYNLMYSRRF